MSTATEPAPTSITPLLAKARAAGLTIRVDGERLVVRGPRSAADLGKMLVSRKAEVLAALRDVPAGWDEALALEVQAAVNARLDVVVASLPSDYPHHQARLKVLANERGLVAGLLAKRDPILWGWRDSLERMLTRWEEEDA
jgi:hypothetical protein